MGSAHPKIPGAGKGKERNTKCPCGSGKKFKLCHGKQESALQISSSALSPLPCAGGRPHAMGGQGTCVGCGKTQAQIDVGAPLTAAPPSTLVKLDLACGETPKEGFEGVDIAGTKAVHKIDLWKFPWPWADNSVDEIYCSHHLEHIPMREVEHRDLKEVCYGKMENPPTRLLPVLPPLSEIGERFIGQDMLFAFMDECWRILKPSAWMEVIVPCARNDRAFQDPTHRRFFVETTFAYFWKEWREANVPQYKVRCNFQSNVGHSIIGELGARTPEVQGEWIRHRWNGVIDLMAKLQAVKT